MTTYISTRTKQELQTIFEANERQLNLCQVAIRNHERDEQTLRERVQQLEAALLTIKRIAAQP